MARRIMTLPAASARPRPRPARREPRSLRAPWLALVCAGYTVLLLVLAAPARPLAWDEAIYFSQVDPRAPAAYFSAPRSRGVTLLGAPVALFTSDPLALRIFLSVLAGLALYASFAVWRRLVGGETAALAALLFGTLWTTIDYGPQMMPDLWVAFGTVAAVGLFLRVAREGPSRARLAGLALAVGWAALTRSNDGVLLALPLLAAVPLVPAGRRLAAAGAVLGGLAAGLAEWVAEAYLRFGGIGPRLSYSGRIEGGIRLAWNVGNALRSANGPILCRPCTTGDGPLALDLWWPAVPLLAALALLAAARGGRRRLAVLGLPAVCAGALAVSYLFLIDYSAPRFFLPSLALLALPVAALATRVVKGALLRPTRPRIGAAVLLGALLAGNLGVQLTVARHQVAASEHGAGQYLALARAVRRLGVRPPCLIAGETQPIAYDAGCSSSLTADLAADASAASGPPVLRAARRESVAILVPPGGAPPGYAPHWTRHRLTGAQVAGWSVYLPPR